MYKFVRETRQQRWDDGNGPSSLARWIYEHLGLTLGALVVLAVALSLGDGRVGFSDLLWTPTLVAVPYSILRLEARAYREWKDSKIDAPG